MVQVIAHRGASRAARENTIEAFRSAARMGADAVELDVRRSLDGVLVVHHNPTLDDGRVVAHVVAPELPDHVPTLSAALDACDGLWVNVEIKNDATEPDFDPSDSIADDTVAQLSARATDSRWLISSFRIETIDRCRAVAPSIRTAFLTVDVPAGTVASLVERGHVALHPWVGAVREADVRACHLAGVQLNTWTCDDPARMGELIGWGIDGICTNVPDVALGVRRRPAQG
jgi:glycerophosphoryl diester phosphodiesterase